MNTFKNYLNKNIFHGNINEKFFTTKKKIFIVIFILIFIAALAISFWGLKIDPAKIWKMFVDGFNKNPLSLLLIFFVFIFPLTSFLYRFSYIHPIIKKNKIKISWIEYFSLFFKITLLNSLTPFASGCEPYVIYWLKSRGLSIQEANQITICNGIISTSTEVLITLPSLILISIQYNEITSSTEGMILYWFIIVGWLINIIMTSLYILLALSKKTQYWISLMANSILKKLKLKHLTKEEIQEKYLTKVEFKKDLKEMIKNWKYSLPISISYAFSTCYLYTTLYFCLNALNSTNINYFDQYGTFFNIINVGLTANNFIPIPGGEGTIQLTLILLSSIVGGISFEDDLFINSIVGFWRIMTTYIPLVVSILWCILYYVVKWWLVKSTGNDNIDNKTIDKEKKNALL